MIQLRSVQMVNWSHLPTTPLGIAAGINAFLGANGSGKSSALDAIKAVLGAKRFGQNRSAASYIHRSPRGEAQEALVLLVVAGCHMITGTEMATLCLSVTRRNRRFLVLDEPLHLGLGSATIDADIADLMRAHPRGTWMNADRWAREVLTPLGVSETVIRLLELPQGEAGRIISPRQQDLLPQLLSMLGFDDRMGLLQDERAQLHAARERRDEARREVLAERRRAAGLEESWRAWQEWTARHDELDAAQAALRGALDQALAASHGAQDASDHDRARLVQLDAARDAAYAALQDRGAPVDLRAEQARALAAARRGSRVVGDHLHPVDAHAARLIAGALGPRLWTVVCTSRAAMTALLAAVRTGIGVAPLAHVRATSVPEAEGLRALAAASDPLVDAYLHHLGLDGAAELHRGVAVGDEWFPEGAEEWSAPDPATPGDPAADLARIEEERAAVRAAIAAAGAQARAEQDRREALKRERSALGDGPVHDAQDIALCRAEVQAARRALDRLPPEEELRADAGRYDAARARIAAAEQILGEHDDLVERLLGALAQAEDLWREEVAGLLDALAARFADLAEAAGMEGELVSSRDGAGEWRIDLVVAEHPGRPRKSFFRDGDLSGGWKAKVGLILMLAAMTGGDARFPVVILDEHAAALDEDRIAEIGEVMRQLAARDGLQFILGLPTRRSHERLEWCDQQLGFLAPAAGEAHAPPPVMISATTGD